MAVKWFASTRARRGASQNIVYSVTFTVKPKGLRFNASMTRFLQERMMTHVRIGIDTNKLVVQPTTEAVGAFKMSNTKSSCQISAASVGDWALTQGISKAVIVGEWDDEEGLFVFDFSDVEKK